MKALQATRRYVRRDVRLAGSVMSWAIRRPVQLAPGSQSISYGRDQIALVWIFMAVTVGEVVAVELLVPWVALRLALLVFGGYALLVMAGYAAANRTLPHVISNSALRIRCGLLANVTIPLASIASVGCGLRGAEWGPNRVGDVLSFGVGGQTHLEIVLIEPRPIATGRDDCDIRTVRFAADDPARGVRLLRAALAAAGLPH